MYNKKNNAGNATEKIRDLKIKIESYKEELSLVKEEAEAYKRISGDLYGFIRMETKQGELEQDEYKEPFTVMTGLLVEMICLRRIGGDCSKKLAELRTVEIPQVAILTEDKLSWKTPSDMASDKKRILAEKVQLKMQRNYKKAVELFYVVAQGEPTEQQIIAAFEASGIYVMDYADFREDSILRDTFILVNPGSQTRPGLFIKNENGEFELFGKYWGTYTAE